MCSLQASTQTILRRSQQHPHCAKKHLAIGLLEKTRRNCKIMYAHGNGLNPKSKIALPVPDAEAEQRRPYNRAEYRNSGYHFLLECCENWSFITRYIGFFDDESLK